jgi:hypothetical protein
MKRRLPGLALNGQVRSVKQCPLLSAKQTSEFHNSKRERRVRC